VQTDDGELGLVDDRRGEDAAERPDVGDGAGTAFELVEGECPLPGSPGEVGDLVRELEHVLAVGVLDNRNDETLRGVDRDSDVVVPLEHQLSGLLVDAGVEDRVVLEHGHQRLDEERQQRESPAPGFDLALDRAVVLEELGDIGLLDMGDVCRDLLRAPHRAGDDLSQVAQRHPFDLPVPGGLRNPDGRRRGLRRRRGRRTTRCRRSGGRGRPFDIVVTDAPSRARSLDGSEIDAQAARKRSRFRRRQRPSTGSRDRRLRLRRRDLDELDPVARVVVIDTLARLTDRHQRVADLDRRVGRHVLPEHRSGTG
jgi:hypothetical protein